MQMWNEQKEIQFLAPLVINQKGMLQHFEFGC